MNLVKLQATLIAAARLRAPDERVPLAFEKRITALIAARAADHWALWTRGLWRSAISCAAIAVISGVWFLATRETPNPNDLSQDFETTLLATADQSDVSQ